jgi:hypothetical protein
MKNLRKEDLSLYLYIKDVVLREFRETEEHSQLNLMPELCNPNSYVYECLTALAPSPVERGRGWVYFDPPSGGSFCEPYPTIFGLNGDGVPAYGTPEQSDSVVLYETTSSGLSVIDWKDYMIDYMDCRIISQRKLNVPKVSFTWNYVSIVDEWAVVEASNPPVVVIDIGGTDKSGYQLGGGKKAIRKVDIHIFASNPAERNDLSETLYDGLFNRSCPLYDFPAGSVLDYDGTFYGRRSLLDRDSNPINKLTYLFDRSKISYISRLQFDAVSARNINLPLVMTRSQDNVILSDLNSYRSRISFNMFSYDDRNINFNG